jgi:type II secretory pathway component PulJ
VTTPDPDTRERVEGPTPNGGAYMIAFFRDADGNPCRKAEAHAMEVVEYNDKDEVIRRTYRQKPGPDVPI